MKNVSFVTHDFITVKWFVNLNHRWSIDVIVMIIEVRNCYKGGRVMDTIVEHVVTAANKKWSLIWKTVAIPLLLSTPVERNLKPSVVETILFISRKKFEWKLNSIFLKFNVRIISFLREITNKKEKEEKV